MPHHHDPCGAPTHTHLQHEPNRYLQIFGLTVVICIVQVLGGVHSHSVSLFSDSVHVASDGFAALISFGVARHIHKHQVTKPDEFSLRRFWMRVSGILLLASLAWVVFEAVSRYLHPAHIIGWSVAIIATIGLLGNWVQLQLIPHGTSTAKMQDKHVKGDLYSSAAVIAGGLIIWGTGWTWVDPLLSLGIAWYIGKDTLKMVWTGEAGHDH